MAKAQRALLWCAAALVLVLLVTGIWLSTGYRPTAAQAWSDIAELERAPSRARDVRVVHRWCASALLVVGVGLVGTSVAASALRLVRGTAWVTATTTVLVAAALVATGSLLPWDQLALRAVTIGTDMRGYGPLFGDEVLFVLRDGVEVSVGELRTLLVLHVAVLPLLLGAALVVLARQAAQQRPSADHLDAEGGQAVPQPSV